LCRQRAPKGLRQEVGPARSPADDPHVRDAERIGGSGCSASSARVQTVYFDANAGQAEGGCMHARYGAVVAVTLAVLPCACGDGSSATSPTLKSPTTASAAVPP